MAKDQVSCFLLTGYTLQRFGTLWTRTKLVEISKTIYEWTWCKIDWSRFETFIVFTELFRFNFLSAKEVLLIPLRVRVSAEWCSNCCRRILMKINFWTGLMYVIRFWWWSESRCGSRNF